VLVTAPLDSAADVAETLVADRLAAGVNRVDCASTYRWDGAVHEADEELLLATTTARRVADLRARVEELHPYDLPAIDRLDADPTDRTAAWVAGAVD